MGDTFRRRDIATATATFTRNSSLKTCSLRTSRRSRVTAATTSTPPRRASYSTYKVRSHALVPALLVGRWRCLVTTCLKMPRTYWAHVEDPLTCCSQISTLATWFSAVSRNGSKGSQLNRCCNRSAVADMQLSIFVCGKSFCVIIYTCYKTFEMVRFLSTLC